MKKILTTIGLSLTLTFPAIASSLAPTQPTVKPYSAAAMGCMILLECTEGVEKLTVDTLLKDPREFLGTMRHEGWHVVQDCMGGGLQTSFMAQVHQDSEIPAWIMKTTRLTYESMMQSRAVPWEADANWAEEQSNVTAEKLEMCSKGPLWDQIRPTPMTMDWLIGCGWMKPQEGKYPYYPNKKVEYCTEGKY